MGINCGIVRFLPMAVRILFSVWCTVLQLNYLRCSHNTSWAATRQILNMQTKTDHLWHDSTTLAAIEILNLLSVICLPPTKAII